MKKATKKINLALQGGGAHGAFTWGVLDRLLEEDSITIDGITGTSAGAMNGAALKSGWIRNGNQGAKDELASFWAEISGRSSLVETGVERWLRLFSPDTEMFARLAEMNPAYLAGDAMSRVFSPYDTNPLNFHPLRGIVTEMLDYDNVCASEGPKLFVSATNVRNGKIKVFSGREITPDALLASACLPTIYQAVEIPDPETGEMHAYWDGGYVGNPALFPLFYETDTSDVLIVHINPIRREEVPRSATDISNRINEISFNSSLLRELRAIEFVKKLLRKGVISPGTMRDVRVHSIMDDDLMTQLGVATKLTVDAAFLRTLHEAGRAQMEAFLKKHWTDLGENETVNLRAMFE